MSIQRDIKGFTKKWAKTMSKNAPVGKRPRSNSAKRLYPEPLNKSIKPLEGPDPGIAMNLYGIFVDQGTRYMSAQPFIDKSFDTAAEEAGEEITDAAFEQIGILFDKTFK